MSKKTRKKIDLVKVQAITELCIDCDRNYRFCDVCLEVFGKVI